MCGSPAWIGASVRSGESATSSERRNPVMGARRRGLVRVRGAPRTGIARAWRFGLLVVTSSPRSDGRHNPISSPDSCRKYQKLLALLTNDDLGPLSARPAPPATGGVVVRCAARHRSWIRGHAPPELPHLLVRPDR